MVTEILQSILIPIFSVVAGIAGTILFYRPTLQKSYAEAKSVEIDNQVKAQDVYQELITDLTEELNRVRNRQKNEIMELDARHQLEISMLESKIKNMCINCKYKKKYEK